MTREIMRDDGGAGDGYDREEDARVTLKELDFTDIYIAEGGSVARMRGLIDVEDPLYTVPIDMVEDLEDVHKKVVFMGQADDEFVLDHDNVRYRVSKINSDGGSNWYAMRRSLDPIPRLNKLLNGVDKAVIAELGRIGKRPGRGLILMAGSTGSGKTTTVCSLLQEYLTAYGDVATTIEDPPELRMEGSYRSGAGQCFQVKVHKGDFATPLRAALRYQPRYILIGELRDPDGASEALRAAISGHIVLATIHSGTIPEAIQSILKLVSARLDMELAKGMLADGLAAVLHQEIRRIKTEDRVERRVKMRALFLGDPTSAAGAAVRSKIREGRPSSLADDIDFQQKRMARGNPPLLPPSPPRS